MSNKHEMVKNLPVMWVTQVLSLGQEDILKKGMAPPPQYSCLENSMDRKVWRATVHGVAKSWTWTHEGRASKTIITGFPLQN